MKISATQTTLMVQFEGFEQLWALKVHHRVELAHVIAVTWHKEKPLQNNFGGIRIPGTSVPFVYQAGHFWRSVGWDLRLLRFKEPGYIVIETKLQKYSRIQLTTDESTAFKIVRWFNQAHGTNNFA